MTETERKKDEAEILREINNNIQESIGGASMCWNPEPSTQVYDSDKAIKISQELFDKIISSFREYEKLSFTLPSSILSKVSDEAIHSVFDINSSSDNYTCGQASGAKHIRDLLLPLITQQAATIQQQQEEIERLKKENMTLKIYK